MVLGEEQRKASIADQRLLGVTTLDERASTALAVCISAMTSGQAPKAEKTSDLARCLGGGEFGESSS